MRLVILSLQISFSIAVCGLNAQSYASFENNTLILDNGVIQRVIQYNADKGSMFSTSIQIKDLQQNLQFQNEDFSLQTNQDQKQQRLRNYLSSNSEEFSFDLDGEKITSMQGWTLISSMNITAPNNGAGVQIILGREIPAIELKITYLLYPDLPLIRKKIEILNKGDEILNLEAVDLELIKFQADFTNCWIMNDYARQKSLGPFVGKDYDPVVVVHHAGVGRGIILGNEAPGVLKRTTAYQSHHLLTIGLTHPNETFPFREWLSPNETWESTWAFIACYANTNDPNSVLNGIVSDYVRKYMGTRLFEIPEKPVFVYNTWEPFRYALSEKLIYELVDAAADCGIGEFVMDDGWQNTYGDWEVNKEKFPNGLKPVFDYIKSKGMKPGLWIGIASAEPNSKVFQEHPEWVVRKADGSPLNLQHEEGVSFNGMRYSMCMTTEWYDYIKNKILNLVKEYGLEYVKCDFAVVTGAYTTDKTRSGCYAPGHNHLDRNESMLKMYRRTWQLFDELHEQAPNLFIDCTFETMGDFQLIDLDMCKHAEGNWLSNFTNKAPFGSFRVRQMAWWRTPAIPATALVIGNQMIDDPNFELSLKSLIGTLPIVLGDPRALSPEQKARVKKWIEWMKYMEETHSIMSFRQDLAGFGEPTEGNWDGFQRMNTETKSGGLIGVFKTNSKENQRRIFTQYLDPHSVYNIYMAPNRDLIETVTGMELIEKGFIVNLEKKNDGEIFEITKINL